MFTSRPWFEIVRKSNFFLSRPSQKMSATAAPQLCFVDVIIPVYNASKTIKEAVSSAMNQTIPKHLDSTCPKVVDVAVCCHNDGSTDDSWDLLEQLDINNQDDRTNTQPRIQSKLLISTNNDGIARGAGYARNRAAALRPNKRDNAPHFLCLLDSDDVMHSTRIAEQVCAMLDLDENVRNRTILGCQFDRDPPDSTWHYTKWANGLTNERLMLEQFREVTLLQPTWFLTKSRFQELDGYIEAPHPNSVTDEWSVSTFVDSLQSPSNDNDDKFRLIHTTYDTPTSLRLAEDLRFFHAHLHHDGLLRIHRTNQPLVTYRHAPGMSQSSRTPRKLLLQLRVMAFEQRVLKRDSMWSKFVIWGAGRDGKDFFKALSSDAISKVACFVDVDEKKIDAGYYVNNAIDARIPIIHFSWLSNNAAESDDNEVVFGRIDKSRNDGNVGKDATSNKREHVGENNVPKKRSKAKIPDGLDVNILSKLPVVVCVALGRTNGALEANVKSVGRTEGKDLWHFS